MSYPDPRYTGTRGEASAVLRRAGQPFDLEMGHGGTQVHESGEPASMLLLFAPGAPREGYFEALAEWAVTGHQPTDEERQEFMLRHDTYWL
jgi:hypothetical protein